MQIDFISSNNDLAIGSYRIWIHNAKKVLQEMNHDVQIVTSHHLSRKDSIVIFSKGDYQDAKSVGREKIVGAINVDPRHSNIEFDFVICGSIEEKLSLQTSYKNVYVVNLIEIGYESCKQKIHTQKDNLVIGYHGSYTHLSKLSNGFVEAFYQMKQVVKDLKIKVITDRPDKALEILVNLGLQDKDVISKKWKYESFLEEISEIDVGIVPNITFFDHHIPDLRKLTSTDAGLYQTDYFLRMKNKSNPGRNFVFFQAGIPVISDLTPSGMPMFYDEKCGSIAICKNTWYSSLRRFLDADERNNVAAIAYNRFVEMYDFRRDIQMLVSNLEKIKNVK